MEYVVIGLLLGYIIFIHLQMHKKDKMIEAMVDKLGKVEKDWDNNQILSLLEKHRVQYNVTPILRNRLFDENVQSFLFANEKDSKTFVHYTKDEFTAKKIAREGFRFIESFDKTAEHVINDSVDLNYKHNIRKYYGKYIVVICIDNEIYNHFNEELRLLNRQDDQPEHIVSGIPSFKNENDEEVFTISNRFIKGYINYENGAIISNPDFSPTHKYYISKEQFN